MSPVLGYARTDRIDRTSLGHRRPSGSSHQRSESPQSHSSQDSTSSGHHASRPANSAGTNLFNRFAGWGRGSGPSGGGSSSSSTGDSNSDEFPLPKPEPARARGVRPDATRSAAPAERPEHPPTSASSSDDGTKPVRIEDYCLGTPRKIGQSHAGGVELYMCVQEKALFLPTVKRQHRRRNRNRTDETEPSEPDANAHSGTALPDADPSPTDHTSNTDAPVDRNPVANTTINNTSSTNTNPSVVTHTSSPANAGPNNDAAAPGEAGPETDQGPSVFDDYDPHDSEHDAENEHDAYADLENEHDLTGSGPQHTLDLHSGGVNDEASAYNSPCSTLRGSVLMKLTKPTKIKEIGVDFYCISRTLWNLLSQSSVLADSTLPNNAQVEDAAYLGIHHWDFVPLEQFGSAQSQYDKSVAGQSATLIGQDLYGADVAVLKDQPDVLQQRKFSRVYNSRACRVRGRSSHLVPVFGPLKARPRKLKPNTVHADGVVFPAGSYVYNFTLLVDAKTPGSVRVPNGQVKFVMAARVVRAGAFSMNVNGHLEVDVVRAPPDATSEGAVFGPLNDTVLLSRVWNDRFVYSLNIERRNMTLDVPTKMTLSLLPLSDSGVKLHQIQVYAMETVTYVYSLDPSIRYVDPELKLLLFQKDARGSKNSGNLLHRTDATTITTDLTLVSSHNKNPHAATRQPFLRGRFGEVRFLEPDVKGPYISVKHRLLLVMRVSRNSDIDNSRCHYEVKIDTPICVQSRHCVAANVRLPTYSVSGTAFLQPSDGEYPQPMFGDDEGNLPTEMPPSFDDAMTHELLGRSGADSVNRRGTKADFRAV